MAILVIGGTGTVGTQVVRRLDELGQRVRVLVRSPQKAENLHSGAEAVFGDLRHPASLSTALRGIDQMFLLTPLSPTEAEDGVAAVRAAEAAHVQHLVYLSIHQVDAGEHIPHFRSKLQIQRALEDSGLSHTLIMPNNFYQNDFWCRQAILQHGVYPQPLGEVGLHRVDVGDIADAVVAVLTKPGHQGKHYPVVGPEALTGPAVAEAYSRCLEKPVHYAGDDLSRWEQEALALMPSGLVQDLKIMYQFFQKHGLLASTEDLTKQERLLGRPPRPFESFARELTALWSEDQG